MVFTSYARGYKGGGFNPSVDEMQFPGIPKNFKPEYVNAFELGTKNRLLDNRLVANLTGFFYDYQNYQISKIAARTAINENIDAFVWGLEAEFLANPIDPLQLNFSLAYLGSEIQSGKSIDPANPAADTPGFVNVQNLQTSAIDVIAAADDPLDPLTPRSEGFEKNLKGNELPNTPDVQINVGGQYTLEIGTKGTLVSRLDYYWQSEMFARMFNSSRDKIDSWSQLNGQMRYTHDWHGAFVEFWAKNIINSNDITAQYFTDASSGNFTNVFLLEPRTFGFTVGAAF